MSQELRLISFDINTVRQELHDGSPASVVSCAQALAQLDDNISN
jgi:hypothetical protein